MDWQHTEFHRIAAIFPDADVQLHGSAADPGTLDGWSDLDLRMITDRQVPITLLLPDANLWAYEDVRTADTEICRMVRSDGRRLDVSVSGAGRIDGLQPAADNDVRFLAALAAYKLGRGDQLIGGHLTLELLRSCLVLAMQLRDRDLGITVHRVGSDRDRYAEVAMELACVPLTITPRPNIVEQTTQLYASWRSELYPAYAPDWEPLTRLIDRGLAAGGFTGVRPG